jgi:cytochrome c553
MVAHSMKRALLLFAAGVIACDPSSPPPVAPAPAPQTAPLPVAEKPPTGEAALDDLRGGQLYDRWWALAPYRGAFEPDDGATGDRLDGKGGPNGNGTLNDAGGQPIANDGHDYRLKSFFGWDLRGAEGIYGPKYQNKLYVRVENLLARADLERASLVEMLRKGDDTLPAYGEVLSDEDLQHLAYFILRVRDGVLPRPDQIFDLDQGAPKGYRLRSGGDAERGRAFYADACARCHGADGKKKTFDDGRHSLGSHARTAAYEDWFKMLNGQPGTAMGRQLPGRHSGSQQAQLMLDLFAALCDRATFPSEIEAEDAPEGDPRCGPY